MLTAGSPSPIGSKAMVNVDVAGSEGFLELIVFALLIFMILNLDLPMNECYTIGCR